MGSSLKNILSILTILGLSAQILSSTSFSLVKKAQYQDSTNDKYCFTTCKINPGLTHFACSSNPETPTDSLKSSKKLTVFSLSITGNTPLPTSTITDPGLNFAGFNWDSDSSLVANVLEGTTTTKYSILKDILNDKSSFNSQTAFSDGSFIKEILILSQDYSFLLYSSGGKIRYYKGTVAQNVVSIGDYYALKPRRNPGSNLIFGIGNSLDVFDFNVAFPAKTGFSFTPSSASNTIAWIDENSLDIKKAMLGMQNEPVGKNNLLYIELEKMTLIAQGRAASDNGSQIRREGVQSIPEMNHFLTLVLDNFQDPKKCSLFRTNVEKIIEGENIGELTPLDITEEVMLGDFDVLYTSIATTDSGKAFRGQVPNPARRILQGDNPILVLSGQKTSIKGFLRTFEVIPFDCHSSCDSCIEEGKNKCQTCVKGQIAVGFDEGECFECHPTCKTCSDGPEETKCTSCLEGPLPKGFLEGKCTVDILDNKRNFPSQDCGGTVIDACVECSKTEDGTCERCMRGAGLDLLNDFGGRKCVICPIENCMRCEISSIGKRTCQKCLDGFKLKGSVYNDDQRCEFIQLYILNILKLLLFVFLFK